MVATNAAAQSLGVVPGMGLASAWGLAPRLAVQERDGAREMGALEDLACWAGNFTPQVSLDPPAGLLLEIGGCRRLFGGLDALLAKALAGLQEQGYTLAAGCAPTPLAARWLANAAPLLEPGDGADPGAVRRCLEGDDLAAALAPLSLDCLDFLERAGPARQRLENFGTRCLGDLLALPRAGLSLRLGQELATRLARALGEVADPRPAFVFPDAFGRGLELPARVEDAGALRFAARRLLQQLQGWLGARGAGVSRCLLELEHERYAGRPPTRLVLGFSGLTRDPERLERVLAEHLGRLVLTAPVTALCLSAEGVGELPGRDQELLPEAETGEGASPSRQAWAVTLERLKARLGEERVHGIAAVAEHRPERATRKTPATADLQATCLETGIDRQSPGMPPQGARPLWLLEHPLALSQDQDKDRPHHNGPLELLAGPERIESGWWDEGEAGASGDLCRDYFVARNRNGDWLWIYRDQEGWFLHGRFA